MDKKPPGHQDYLAKEIISLTAIFILLLVNSPLSIFYFPALAKACVTIDIFVFFIWMLLLIALGEVFVRKREDRIEKILVSDNEYTTAMLINTTIFAVIILILIGVIIKSENLSSSYFSIFLQIGHAIYFILVLYFAHRIMIPAIIEIDGDTIKITQSIAMRYHVSGKLIIPFPYIHFLLRPLSSLFLKSPSKKTIEIPINKIQIIPMEKNFAGNSKPLFIVMDKDREETKAYIVLENDKSLEILKDAFREYLQGANVGI